MRSLILLLTVILRFPPSAQIQHSTQSVRAEEPIATTVCKIVEDPPAFNNKLVSVRGYVSISSEYSVLHSESCPEGIWFALADGSGPPGLAATVQGKGVPGEMDSNGHRTDLIPVKLIRHENFEKFEVYLTVSVYSPPWSPCGAGCHRYRVTATFTGRIDAVSKEVHAAHVKKPPSLKPDFKGFGQMGLFDAQLVVQSVKEVEAVDLAHPHRVQPD